MPALWDAWLIFTNPATLGFAIVGVFLGLIIGAIPGLGGIFGLALLIPITYGLEAHHAIYLLIGLTASTTISDTIPAVLIGVPGSVGASPTAVDGHILAKQGLVARVLGAAYLSSLIGGLVGAIFLSLTVPLMAPLLYYLKIPDFFALGLMGLGAVILVSDRDIARGIVAAGLGLWTSFVGLDAMTGEERWTFGNPTFWEGLPTAAVFFGLFCLPELASLSRKKKIAASIPRVHTRQLHNGISDVLREWRLAVGSGISATFMGLIPGVGLSAISWIIYAMAARKTNGGPRFGEGNIRGVIAPESAANATEGGTLIPTVAFGVPGSASMALLLAALTIQGIVPGPEMLTKHADLTFSMVFALVFANIIGTFSCIVLTSQFARLATLPAKLIVIVTLVMVFYAALQIRSNMIDVFVLFVFGVLGLLMKQAGWSRPAFILGFVLGPVLEQNFSLTMQLYGVAGFLRPSMILVIMIALFFGIKNAESKNILFKKNAEQFNAVSAQDQMLLSIALGVILIVVIGAYNLSLDASLFPLTAALLVLTGTATAITQYRNSSLHRPRTAKFWTLDIVEEFGLLVMILGLAFGVLFIGPFISTFVLVAGFLYLGGFAWHTVSGMSLILSLGCVGLFSKLANLSWPATSIEAKLGILSFF